MAAVTPVDASGIDLVDGLLYSAKWAQPITYGLPATALAYAYTPEPGGFSALTGPAELPGSQAWAVAQAFAQVSSFTALAIAPAADPASADIRLAMTSTPGGNNGPNFVAYAYLPYPTDKGGDVWFNATLPQELNPGALRYRTVLHEIGHALGLKHGHSAEFGFPALPAESDSHEFSLMTYRSFVGMDTGAGYQNQDGHHPQTYMMADIGALQHLYGANFAFRAGDTRYEFDPGSGVVRVDGAPEPGPADAAGDPVNVLFRTIWDGGGTDSYDFSAYGAAHHLAIDLGPGNWTDVDSTSTHQAAYLGGGPNGGYARGQIANALLHGSDTRSLIENATGGEGNDLITGNQAMNRLDGGDGNDTLAGLDGDDTLTGGAGADTLDGGDGSDTADYGAATGRVILNLGRTVPQDTQGAGIDTLIGIENAIGGAFKDSLVGNALDNRLDGGGGNDIVEGRDGNDVLEGGGGIDLVHYTAAPGGVLVSLAQQGSWQQTASAGLDFLSGFENLAGSGFDDRLAGDSGNNVLSGLAGDDILAGGAGNDALRGDEGIDTADYSDAMATLRVSLDLGGAQDTLAAGRDTLVAIENLVAGAGADLLWGNASANRIEGGAGNDFIGAAAGDDVLLGGDGNDVLIGGLGADRLELGAGRDIVRFTAGADSRAASADLVVGFAATGQDSDRIGFENAADALFTGVTPGSIALASTIALAAAASIADLVLQLTSLAASTASSLAVTRIDVASGGAAGSYLAVNDTGTAFDEATDMLVGIQFASAAPLGASSFFLF
ncbi:MAG: M10 family metallopeptidase C-terminal domain-containing protein [Acetobacteraceae bacterium]|nr:M10 family metallopeptidase C-terminal domain-containing protein [Acetobacteraceae bacterium]